MLQWRRFGNGLTAALDFQVVLACMLRACHVCEHPQRARDPWPAASPTAKSGSMIPDYSRVPPGRAVVVEAERSRVERGRPRDRGPAHSGGCGGTSTVATKSASERQSPSPARLLAPSPCGAGGMAPPLPLRRGGQARAVPVASVRQWPRRRCVGSGVWSGRARSAVDCQFRSHAPASASEGRLASSAAAASTASLAMVPSLPTCSKRTLTRLETPRCGMVMP